MKEGKGRGGAIYLNPTFSYANYNLDNASYLRKATIEGCTFTRNKAFDGYAIYIEGFEGVSTEFVIKDNKFIDNYDESIHSSNKSVIASEMLSINYE